MIEKNFVNKILNKIRHPESSKGGECSIMHPEREWFIGLVMGLVVLGFGIWWNINTYFQYNNISTNNSEVMPGVVIYRESLVKAALSEFDERTNRYESLQNQLAGEGELLSVTATGTEAVSEDGAEVGADETEDADEGGEESKKETEDDQTTSTTQTREEVTEEDSLRGGGLSGNATTSLDAE